MQSGKMGTMTMTMMMLMLKMALDAGKGPQGIKMTN